jgi:hypothetical protein
MRLDPNADVVTLDELADRLIEKITNYIEEQKEYDENDSTWDYIGGLVSAYQSVAGMIGIPLEIYDIGEVE